MFKSTEKKSKFDTRLLIVPFVVIAGISLIKFSKEASSGTKNGIDYCLQILIPSLFPFMALANFTLKSGISSSLGRILNPITRFLFNLPGSCGIVILMGLVGGYPVGSNGVKDLYDKGEITYFQAKRMLWFSFCAGPAFVITAVGSSLIGSYPLGIMLFFSQVFSSILIGIFLGAISRNEKTVIKAQIAVQKTNLSQAFVESVTDSVKGMGMICGFVILFSSISSILNSSGVLDSIAGFLQSLGMSESLSTSIVPLVLEVTGGCQQATQNNIPLEIIAFGLSWGGVCVQMQICASISKTNLFSFKFVLARIIQGLISAVAFKGLLLLFPQVQQTFISNTTALSGTFYKSVPTCIALVFMCVIFLFSVTFNKNVDISKRK